LLPPSPGSRCQQRLGVCCARKRPELWLCAWRVGVMRGDGYVLDVGVIRSRTVGGCQQSEDEPEETGKCFVFYRNIFLWGRSAFKPKSRDDIQRK
jgi:hypothetical protein